MHRASDSVAFRLWVFVVVILIASNLIILSLHLSAANASGVSPVKFSYNPSFISKTFSSLGRTAGHEASLIDQAGFASIRFAKQTFSSVTDSVSSTAVGFIHSVGHVASLNSKSGLASYVRPASQSSQPIIAQLSSSTQTTKSTPAPATPPPSITPQWPIYGWVTLNFGQSFLPYESFEDGIDITDGTAPGTTPVKPFKPGVVSQVIHSAYGLGNHIIIDHGSGMTSIYGHLNSTSVQVGQQVDENTVLGYEGTTGASTGTHICFQIWINGQPHNPRDFISGQP